MFNLYFQDILWKLWRKKGYMGANEHKICWVGKLHVLGKTQILAFTFLNLGNIFAFIEWHYIPNLQDDQHHHPWRLSDPKEAVTEKQQTKWLALSGHWKTANESAWRLPRQPLVRERQHLKPPDLAAKARTIPLRASPPRILLCLHFQPVDPSLATRILSRTVLAALCFSPQPSLPLAAPYSTLS